MKWRGETLWQHHVESLPEEEQDLLATGLVVSDKPASS
jgi:hypothetical protein